MKNGDVNEFLDTLLYNDHYVLYEGKKYFFNAVGTNKDRISMFEVYRLTLNDDYEETVYRIETKDDPWGCIELFQKAKVFNEKSFWEVESEMTWVDG